MICETYPRPCKHTKASGEPCRAFAVYNSELCYFHQRDERLRLAIHDRVRVMHAKARGEKADARRIEELEAAEHFASLELPPLEDPAAVRQWVTAILRAMAAGQLPVKMAKGMLYGLSLAMNASSLAIREYDHEVKKEFVNGLFNQIQNLEQRTLTEKDRYEAESCTNAGKPFPDHLRTKVCGDSRAYGSGVVRKESLAKNVPSPTGGKPSSFTPSEVLTNAASAAPAPAASTAPTVAPASLAPVAKPEAFEKPETRNEQPPSNEKPETGNEKPSSNEQPETRNEQPSSNEKPLLDESQFLTREAYADALYRQRFGPPLREIPEPELDIDPGHPGLKPGEEIAEWKRRKRREREEKERQEKEAAQTLQPETIPEIKACAEVVTSAAKAEYKKQPYGTAEAVPLQDVHGASDASALKGRAFRPAETAH
jgi:hypothetical protein